MEKICDTAQEVIFIMKKVAFVRGSYLNKSEWQNYDIKSKNLRIDPISTFKTIHYFKKSIKLFGLSDINSSKYSKYFFNRLIGDNQVLFGLKNAVADYNILHTADPHYYYSYQLAKIKGDRPLVSTYWETIPFNNETVAKKRLIKRFTMENTDLFICHTQKAKKCIQAEGFSHKKIELIPLGVDLSRFKPKNRKSNKTKTILYVGRLVEEKGVSDLYEAFKICVKSNTYNRLRLHLVGNGHLKNVIYQKAKKDGLIKNIQIINKSYDSIHHVYNQAAIFVLPSKKTKTWEEQYGMVLIEALASGLPVIAYDTGAIAEVLNGNGELVEERKIKKLSERINYLLNNRDKAIKIGLEGRKFAENKYNCIDYQKKIKNLYLSLK